MRFMMLVKSAENSGPPPKELMEAIAKLGEEASKAGNMISIIKRIVSLLCMVVGWANDDTCPALSIYRMAGGRIDSR